MTDLFDLELPCPIQKKCQFNGLEARTRTASNTETKDRRELCLSKGALQAVFGRMRVKQTISSGEGCSSALHP